jgi:hypothetical protein
MKPLGVSHLCRIVHKSGKENILCYFEFSHGKEEQAAFTLLFGYFHRQK